VREVRVVCVIDGGAFGAIGADVAIDDARRRRAID